MVSPEIVFKEYNSKLSYERELMLDYDEFRDKESLLELFYVGGGVKGGEKIIYHENDTIITTVKYDTIINLDLDSEYGNQLFIYKIIRNREMVNILKRDRNKIQNNNDNVLISVSQALDIDKLYSEADEESKIFFSKILDTDKVMKEKEKRDIVCLVFYKAVKKSEYSELINDWNFLNELSKRMNKLLTLFCK